MRVLLSAYACEPNKGSEPEVGWRWAIHLAQEHHVVVLTRSNNREKIEGALQLLPNNLNRPKFLYLDLWGWLRRIKKKGRLGLTFYYILWQVVARIRMQKILSSFDIIHHLTFNSFRLPGFWWGTRKPIVLGPLGGGQTTSKYYLPLFRENTQKEKRRTSSVQRSAFNPVFRISCWQAALILVANAATENIIPKLKGRRIIRMLETGIEQKKIQEPKLKPWRGTLLWVGALEKWKAGELAIRTLAAGRKTLHELQLIIIGEGTDSPYLKSLATELRVSEFVDFRGKCTLEEVADSMKEADLFLFTSIRDTSGNVVLEAMSAGVPVLAIRHHGIAEICTPECAWLIEPSDIKETVEQFTEGLLKLSANDEARFQMARSATKRLLELFVWNSKAKIIADLYKKVLANPHTPTQYSISSLK